MLDSALDSGSVTVTQAAGIARVTFFHPKSNSLPGELLADIAQAVTGCGQDPAIQVVVLQSLGDRAFCAGASFDELLSIGDAETGKRFFMGFARLILAVRACPKFVIARVQGKAVGGGVGVAAAADYCLARDTAAIKLSELAIGFGPFVIGPAVERKMGTSAFSTLTIDTAWRDAVWARANGLYVDIFDSLQALDGAVDALAQKLAGYNLEAMAALKKTMFEGTEHWPALLEERAAYSGRLVLSKFTGKAIHAFGKK